MAQKKPPKYQDGGPPKKRRKQLQTYFNRDLVPFYESQGYSAFDAVDAGLKYLKEKHPKDYDGLVKKKTIDSPLNSVPGDPFMIGNALLAEAVNSYRTGEDFRFDRLFTDEQLKLSQTVPHSSYEAFSLFGGAGRDFILDSIDPFAAGVGLASLAKKAPKALGKLGVKAAEEALTRSPFLRQRTVNAVGNINRVRYELAKRAREKGIGSSLTGDDPTEKWLALLDRESELGRAVHRSFNELPNLLDKNHIKQVKKAVNEGNSYVDKWFNSEESLKRYQDLITPDDGGMKEARYHSQLANKQHTVGYDPKGEAGLDTKVIDLLRGKSRSTLERSNATGMSGHPLNLDAFNPDVTYTGSTLDRVNIVARGRSPKEIFSTTVHEGTHGATSGTSLLPQKMKKRIDDLMLHGDETDEYFRDPTEVHARIMETRAHYGIATDEKVGPRKAKKIYEDAYARAGQENGPPIDPQFFQNIIGQSEGLRWLLNNLPAAGAVTTATQMGKKKSGKQKKQIGGPIKAYQYGGPTQNALDAANKYKNSQQPTDPFSDPFATMFSNMFGDPNDPDNPFINGSSAGLGDTMSTLMDQWTQHQDNIDNQRMDEPVNHRPFTVGTDRGFGSYFKEGGKIYGGGGETYGKGSYVFQDGGPVLEFLSQSHDPLTLTFFAQAVREHESYDDYGRVNDSGDVDRGAYQFRPESMKTAAKKAKQIYESRSMDVPEVYQEIIDGKIKEAHQLAPDVQDELFLSSLAKVKATSHKGKTKYQIGVDPDFEKADIYSMDGMAKAWQKFHNKGSVDRTDNFKESMKRLKHGGNISTMGYREDSPDVNNPFNVIPGGDITMDNVNKDLMLIPDQGQPVFAVANSGNYSFPGANSVTEIPIGASGGFMDYLYGGSVPKFQRSGSIGKLPEGTKEEDIYVLGYEKDLRGIKKNKIDLFENYATYNIRKQKGKQSHVHDLFMDDLRVSAMAGDEKSQKLVESYYSVPRTERDEKFWKPNKSEVIGWTKQQVKLYESTPDYDETFTREFNRAGRTALERNFGNVHYLNVRGKENLGKKMGEIPEGSNVMFMDHSGDMLFGTQAEKFVEEVGKKQPKICIGGSCHGEDKLRQHFDNYAPGTSTFLDKNSWWGFNTDKKGLDSLLWNENFKEEAMRDAEHDNLQQGGEIEQEQPQPQEVQTEKGEMVAFQDGSITPVKARKRHSQMKSDEATDILPPGAYVLSRDPDMKLHKGTADEISFGREPISYRENKIGEAPKEIFFGEIFNKATQTPAQIGKNIRKKFPITERQDDAFAGIAQKENKMSRYPYIQALQEMSERKRTEQSDGNFQQGGFTNMSNMLSGMYNHPNNKAIDGMQTADPYQTRDNNYMNQQNGNFGSQFAGNLHNNRMRFDNPLTSMSQLNAPSNNTAGVQRNQPAYRGGGPIPQYGKGGELDFIPDLVGVGWDITADIFGLSPEHKARKLQERNQKKTEQEAGQVRNELEGLNAQGLQIGSASVLGQFLAQDPTLDFLEDDPRMQAIRSRTENTYDDRLQSLEARRRSTENTMQAPINTAARMLNNTDPRAAQGILAGMYADYLNSAGQNALRYDEFSDQLKGQRSDALSNLDFTLAGDTVSKRNLQRDREGALGAGLAAGLGAEGQNFLSNQSGIITGEQAVKIGARNQSASVFNQLAFSQDARRQDYIQRGAQAGTDLYNYLDNRNQNKTGQDSPTSVGQVNTSPSDNDYTPTPQCPCGMNRSTGGCLPC